MPSLACPACGSPATEFDPRCASCGSPLPGSSATEKLETGEIGAGQVISHFRILGPLGRGGMGVVYRALDLDLEREVALKFLAPRVTHSAREEARFRREAQAAASLDHPNIGTLYGLGEHDGRRFLVLALYEGETLHRRLERPPLPLPEAAAVAGQLASALAAAHAAGVVHRDLKPSNVMLTRDGRVKLLDFGLARRSGAAPLTEVGVAVGTAAYMAPEQLRGEEADARADLWALGVVLFEMLAGRHPFGGTAQPGLVHAILHEPPPVLRDLRPDVPAALERIVERCLAKAPDRRWQGAGEILAELETAGLWTSGPATATTTAVPLPRRRTRLLEWVAVAVLVLLTALAILFWRSRRAEATIYVAVPRPQVTGSVAENERARVALNLQVAALRALTALEGVAPLDPGLLRGIAGTPSQIAHAVAADEVVTAESDCTAESCVVTLRRLAGEDGRVLWTEVLRLHPHRPRLFAEAVTAAVRRAYPDRETRLDGPELAVEEPEYRRFLDLRRALDDRSVPPEQILERLGDLRRRAPSFLEAYSLESGIAASLFRTSGDRRYLDRGLEVARRARELAPGDPRPLNSLFDLTLAAGRLDNAAALLEDIERMAPGAPGLLLRQARLAEQRGEPEAAAELLARAAERQPSWEMLQTLANLEYRLGRFDAARGHLEQLLRRSPGNVRGLETLAQIELLDGDPARSVELYADLARRTGSAEHWSNLGTALLLLKRHDDAERVFRRALSAAPGNPLIELNLADSLWLLGRRDEAARVYRRLAERVGDEEMVSNWQLHSAKAQALAHLGERERAVESVQTVLRLTPDHPQAAFEAALVYTLVGDRSSALLYIEKAVRGGVGARWFSFSWFDPLRQDPSFTALLGPEAPLPPEEDRSDRSRR